jgi:hypothetical protein
LRVIILEVVQLWMRMYTGSERVHVCRYEVM